MSLFFTSLQLGQWTELMCLPVAGGALTCLQKNEGKYLFWWQNSAQLLLNNLCREGMVWKALSKRVSSLLPTHDFMLKSKPGQLCSLARSGNRLHTHTHFSCDPNHPGLGYLDTHSHAKTHFSSHTHSVRVFFCLFVFVLFFCIFLPGSAESLAGQPTVTALCPRMNATFSALSS